MENINDILLKYSGKEIIVVLDVNKKVWFNVVQICNILKYTNPKNITYKLVDKEFIKQLKNIVNDYKIYPNA
jgi:prophage antirepressor-like protein